MERLNTALATTTPESSSLAERVAHLGQLKQRWAERESTRQQESTRTSIHLLLNDSLPPLTVKPHNRSQVRGEHWEAMLGCAVIDGHWPMVLTGDVGTGKTCAALCLLDLVGTRRYTTVQAMCDTLIRHQQKDAHLVGDWWEHWERAKCVCLDELGTRDKVSEFHYECVKRAIDLREGKPLIAISNLPISELATLYDDRIASRLAGGTVIHFKGKDRRLQ